MKNIRIFYWKISFGCKIFILFEKVCFPNDMMGTEEA